MAMIFTPLLVKFLKQYVLALYIPHEQIKFVTT